MANVILCLYWINVPEELEMTRRTEFYSVIYTICRVEIKNNWIIILADVTQFKGQIWIPMTDNNIYYIRVVSNPD